VQRQVKLVVLFIAAVVALFLGLVLLARRNPVSVVLIAFAVITVFATSFSRLHREGTRP